MDFIEELRNLSARITKQKDVIQTEEATKTAFVMPFINLLGYDVFNPLYRVSFGTAEWLSQSAERESSVSRFYEEIRQGVAVPPLRLRTQERSPCNHPRFAGCVRKLQKQSAFLKGDMEEWLKISPSLQRKVNR